MATIKDLHSYDLAHLLMGPERDPSELTTGITWAKYHVISSILATKLSKKDMVTILEYCDGERRLGEAYEARQGVEDEA